MIFCWFIMELLQKLSLWNFLFFCCRIDIHNVWGRNFPKLGNNKIHTFLCSPSPWNTLYRVKWNWFGETLRRLHFNTPSGDIIQMSQNTPKVMGDYLCNSHLPINELQVHSGGTALGMHSCVRINRITKREELFWTFKVLVLKSLLSFFPPTFADWQLEHLQGLDGHETLPSCTISTNNKQLQWQTAMRDS